MNCPRTQTTDTGPIHRTLLIKKNCVAKFQMVPIQFSQGVGVCGINWEFNYMYIAN